MLNDSPITIVGGRQLHGEIAINASKNAALPVIAAALLTAEPVTLHGVPRLSDVYILLDVMAALGTHHTWVGANSLRLHTPAVTCVIAPDELVGKMRATFLVMGALLARQGEAVVAPPGGCTFSQRPVDQHLKAFRAMGAEVRVDGGAYHATLRGSASGSVVFDLLTVGGTQNAMLAAVLGDGDVTIDNASIDTDVMCLADFLNSLGAVIEGAGTHTIRIEGVPALRGGDFRIIPDRIEAGTFLAIAAATRSRLTLTNVIPSHLRAVTGKLRDMGAVILETGDVIMIDARDELRAVNVTTSEYPAFPTDVQPQFSALLATVGGTSVVVDRIYPGRTTHVAQLHRMGARAELMGETQIIHGGPLQGTTVQATNIRDGAALVIAALAAEGESTIEGTVYLNRGYERLVDRLRAVGADIRQCGEQAALPFAVAME
ncbi:UDP-N-acetylglucosamine 1-carboxyvinyltransferase [Deinococcus soli (ex Cha et al. 2016)]|uniref:UDP-N-acetylglucosamine 1-carboxyvinyltransferase n=2 Tax=Deinococcus soli (ex Cha et al. 2016) TaxID=1309411 RepID=A0AAE3XDK8_9DEIO|nr:UDP-N-acetylglucosamine 1-carboxyvinyltransferase [Deinococcus soli (ex Cha et al. 2016)]MDR6328880.1 UDP-N-acetylglucosamine 1-carboxyvinyltransferase [Deinococcus soli (ex Cha et al. 2016)]MDR6751632.1 UDP-N-acetylglucosamine 1-carboxyvinyltransferase [Deinococcus soli (ex Cha et al. 2016)]